MDVRVAKFSRIRPPCCIVAAGGDGTVDSVINRYSGTPLAILPLGTENLLARFLSVKCCGHFVAEMIAAGRTQSIDLGILGERRFAIMASVGFEADVVHRTDSRRTGTVTKFNYLQPIWESLRSYRYPKLRIYVDDASEPVVARLLIVVDLPAYALGLRIADAARGDDGLLDARLFHKGSAFQMLWYCYKVLRNEHEQLADVTSLRARSIRVECASSVPVQVDGDPAGTTPAEIRVLPKAARFVIPVKT